MAVRGNGCWCVFVTDGNTVLLCVYVYVGGTSDLTDCLQLRNSGT